VLLPSKIPLSAAILAGGRSTRMGKEKCLLKIRSKKIIDHIIANLKDLFQEIFIVTNSPQHYFFSGFTLFGDIYPYRGPMSGIHVSLKNSKFDVFAFACDMPFVKKDLIYTLSEIHLTGKSYATVGALDEKIYPLPGIYSKKTFDELERLIKENKLSMMKFVRDMDAQVVNVANLDKEGLSFININTEDDLLILEKGGIRCLD